MTNPLLGYGCHCGMVFKTQSAFLYHQEYNCPKTAEKKKPQTFAQALDQEMKNTIAAIKKEEPMNTMTFEQISKAKKQRDVLRNRLRVDIKKFADKFGISEFEAAHAVVDGPLGQINESSKSYGKCEMKFSLAQSLLPDTQNLISGESGEQSPGSTVSMDEILPGAPSSFMAQYSTMVAEKTASKVSFSGPLKKDIYVTDHDIDLIALATHKSLTKAKEAINTLGVSKYHHFFYGKKYISGYAAQDAYGYMGLTLHKGWNWIVFSVPKTAPYVSLSFMSQLSPIAPTGYKWRKLKNKKIYKLTIDPKQTPKKNLYQGVSAPKPTSIWATAVASGVGPGPEIVLATHHSSDTAGHPSTISLAVDNSYSQFLAQKIELPEGYFWLKNPHQHKSTLMKLSHGNIVVPISLALSSPIPKESGYHWETYISNPTKAVVTYTSTTSDGFSSPKAVFPPKPSVTWGAGYEPGGKYDF